MDTLSTSLEIPGLRRLAHWIELLDRYPGAKPPEDDSKNFLNKVSECQATMNSLMGALPPVASWDAISAALKHRPGTKAASDPAGERAGSMLLALAMQPEPGIGPEEMARARSILVPGKARSLAQKVSEVLYHLAFAPLVAVKGTPEERLAYFDMVLSREAAEKEATPGNAEKEVPDLVGIGGKERARPLLKRALRREAELDVKGRETKRLAAEMVMQDITLIKRPMWSLVTELSDAPLYEKMKKHFAPITRDYSAAEKNADMVWLASLIAANRSKEASRLYAESLTGHAGEDSLDLDRTVLDQLEKGGVAAQTEAFLHDSLANNPGLALWDNYIAVCARAEHSGEALAFLREICARPDLKIEARETAQSHLVDALLAADNVEEGVALLRETVRAGAEALKDAEEKADAENKKEEKAEAARKPSGNEEEDPRNPVRDREVKAFEGQMTRCLKLGRVEALIGRLELVEEALTAARSMLASPYGLDDWTQKYALTEFLLEQGRYAEAEAIEAEAYLNDATDKKMKETALEHLVIIYYYAGLPGDAARLLDEASGWSLADVSEFIPDYDDAFSTPLLLAVANALAKTGRTEAARAVAKRLIEQKPGCDPAFALLVVLAGPGLEAWLDAQAAADRFATRPLIWKATLQLGAGRLDDAEKTVRAAIKIDPSDGEEGKGDRMRAYSVLGDILAKKGLAEQAKTVRQTVEAIRIAERADDFWNAGLLTRAVKMYEEGLSHFADAYCIQSRLAMRYVDLGDFEKAAQYYQRAYELMPESFGEVESHCFACEGDFGGVRAQGIAEKVFTQLAEKTPDKPQVFYLLGYLREQEGDLAEAVVQYRKAAKLDPDYMNAWKRLVDLSDKTYVPQEVIDAAVLAEFQLDPLFRHHEHHFDKTGNIRALWAAILKQEKESPRRSPAPVYPLAASKKALDEERPGKNSHAEPNPSASHEDDADKSPRTLLMETNLFQQLESLLN